MQVSLGQDANTARTAAVGSVKYKMALGCLALGRLALQDSLGQDANVAMTAAVGPIKGRMAMEDANVAMTAAVGAIK